MGAPTCCGGRPGYPCREQPSPFRDDGLCYAHGKAADGRLTLGVTGLGGVPGEKRGPGRPAKS